MHTSPTNPYTLSLHDALPISNFASVTPSVTRPPSLTVAEVAPPSVGPSATGLTVSVWHCTLATFSHAKVLYAEIDSVAEVSPAVNVSAVNCAAVPVQLPVPAL